MKKAILEFDLSEQEGKEDFNHAIKAVDYHLALWDFSNDILRQARKYGTLDGKALTKTEIALMEKVSELFYAMLNDRDIQL